MNKDLFRNLLTDLYTIYNPGYLTYVDDLVEKNHHLAFDALKNIFIKYNSKRAPYYDAKLGTDEHVLYVIKEYDNNNRIFQDLDLKGNIIEHKTEIKDTEKEEVQQIIEDAKSKSLSKYDELEIFFKDEKNAITEHFKKEKEHFEAFVNKKKYELEKANDIIVDKIRQNHKEKKQLIEEDTLIRIFSTYTNSELDLPNKKLLSSLGQGTKIITRDTENNVIGLEITEVSIDFITDIDKPIIEIFVNKA